MMLPQTSSPPVKNRPLVNTFPTQHLRPLRPQTATSPLVGVLNLLPAVVAGDQKNDIFDHSLPESVSQNIHAQSHKARANYCLLKSVKYLGLARICVVLNLPQF